jgi:hypothetical protein
MIVFPVQICLSVGLELMLSSFVLTDVKICATFPDEKTFKQAEELLVAK